MLAVARPQIILMPLDARCAAGKALVKTDSCRSNACRGCARLPGCCVTTVTRHHTFRCPANSTPNFRVAASILTSTRVAHSAQMPRCAAGGAINVPKDHSATPAMSTLAPPILYSNKRAVLCIVSGIGGQEPHKDSSHHALISDVRHALWLGCNIPGWGTTSRAGCNCCCCSWKHAAAGGGWRHRHSDDNLPAVMKPALHAAFRLCQFLKRQLGRDLRK
jgi:hypothetical protein